MKNKIIAKYKFYKTTIKLFLLRSLLGRDSPSYVYHFNLLALGSENVLVRQFAREWFCREFKERIELEGIEKGVH